MAQTVCFWPQKPPSALLLYGWWVTKFARRCFNIYIARLLLGAGVAGRGRLSGALSCCRFLFFDGGVLKMWNVCAMSWFIGRCELVMLVNYLLDCFIIRLIWNTKSRR